MKLGDEPALSPGTVLLISVSGFGMFIVQSDPRDPVISNMQFCAAPLVVVPGSRLNTLHVRTCRLDVILYTRIKKQITTMEGTRYLVLPSKISITSIPQEFHQGIDRAISGIPTRH